MRKLKIGLVCMRADNFDGGLQKNFKAATDTLKSYSDELDYDFFSYPELILTPASASSACNMISEQKPDFLMIQFTAFP